MSLRRESTWPVHLPNKKERQMDADDAVWTIRTLGKVALEDEGLSTETLADMHQSERDRSS
jgi:hypothetical protein